MKTTERTVHPNPAPVKPRPYWFATIPGELAVLCLDCGEVYDLRAGASSCGSKAGLLIMKALDRRGARVEVSR